MTSTVPESRMDAARGTVYRRIRLETSILGEMIERGNHKSISYQSGLVDGMNIVASLSLILDKGENEQPG